MSEDITRREALKKGALLGGAALVWVRPSVQTYGMSATLAQQASGTAGCSPGFWGQNPERAEEYISNYRDLKVHNWFDHADATWGLKLTEVLSRGGGGGAEYSLMFHAVAGYLNATAFEGMYAFSTVELKSQVNGAIGSDDAMEKLKNTLDLENNAGCLLSAWESDRKGPPEKSDDDSKKSDQVFGVTEDSQSADGPPESAGGGKGKGGEDE